MPLANKIQLTVPDNFLRNNPGLKVAPGLVLINLAILAQQLASGDFDPAEHLAPQELLTYRQFKYPKRQIEWLGGRLAAKQSVLHLHGKEVTIEAMREWPIQADEHGKPFFKSTVGGLPGLSISHSHGLAMAMAANSKDCGLDLQKISATTIRVKEKFCSQTEERLIASLDLPDKNQATGLSLLWAAKEALRKARGGHPLTGFAAMHLTEAVRPNDHYWLFTLGVESEQYLVTTFFYEDFAVAIIII